jgi:hypothetical protein
MVTNHALIGRKGKTFFNLSKISHPSLAKLTNALKFNEKNTRKSIKDNKHWLL